MKIAVCGCGWLGGALAKALSQDGYPVIGTKRDRKAAMQLMQWGIEGFPMQLPLTTPAQIQALLPVLSCDVMVINIAAGRSNIDKTLHYQNILSLSGAALQAGCQRVIFVSTTSVYDGHTGRVNEADDVKPVTESAIVHVKIEQALRQQWGDKLTILRLSGLIGEDRHPVTFLSGRKAIKHGNSPVNLIHREDCIAAIKAIINNPVVYPVLHLAASQHPTRKDYYTKMAMQLSLPLPEFDVDDKEEGKVIDASHTLAWLGIQLRYDHLLLASDSMKR